jgi:hypothetical protein
LEMVLVLAAQTVFNCRLLFLSKFLSWARRILELAALDEP